MLHLFDRFNFIRNVWRALANSRNARHGVGIIWQFMLRSGFHSKWVSDWWNLSGEYEWDLSVEQTGHSILYSLWIMLIFNIRKQQIFFAFQKTFSPGLRPGLYSQCNHFDASTILPWLTEYKVENEFSDIFSL